MKTCLKCGASINDAQNIEALGYTIEPKYCECCRREIRSYRKKSNIVRTELRRWDNVLFTDLPFEKEVRENEDKYLVYRFGGRRFGRCGWTGVAHSGKVLVFVSREWDRSAPALVRLMSKKHEAGENDYLVIEPAQDTTLPQSRAYYVEDYYKTTMRGHGRDRNLTHVVEGEYDVVLEGTTRSRSGRFGNKFRLLIADELRVEAEGVA